MMSVYRCRIAIVVMLFLGICVGMLSACAYVPVQSPQGTVTTVILIRHADRHNSQDLNELGRLRAQLLVEAVKDMGINAIYSPDIGRNLDTVRPLAAHLGLEITLTPQFSLPVVDEIAAEIVSQHAGKVVLVVGNVTGNLQALYKKFGGNGDGPLEYGDLHILRIKSSGAPDIEKRRWGPPSQEVKKT